MDVASDRVLWIVRNRRYRLEMLVDRAAGGLLHEPTQSEMLQRVEETMLATVQVNLATLDGEKIYAGRGRNTALEVNGDLNQLLAMK